MVWMRLMGLWVIAAGAVGVLLVVANIAPPVGPRDEVTNALAVVGVILVAIGCGVGLAESRAALSELRAGYMTLGNRYLEYWQVDPDSGEVLRRPGENRASPRS